MAALASDQHKGMVVAVGQVGGRPDLVKVLRDSGCSTMVIRKDLCDPDDFTGETRGCVMMDGRVIEVPVVTKTVDTPYYTGLVEGVAMDSPVYDLVIGNLLGAWNQEDPDTSWEPSELKKTTVNAEKTADIDIISDEITDHVITGGVVTRSQSKDKPLRPLKVAKTKIVNLSSKEFRRLQETDKTVDKLQQRIENVSSDVTTSDKSGDSPCCDGLTQSSDKIMTQKAELVEVHERGGTRRSQCIVKTRSEESKTLGGQTDKHLSERTRRRRRRKMVKGPAKGRVSSEVKLYGKGEMGQTKISKRLLKGSSAAANSTSNVSEMTSLRLTNEILRRKNEMLIEKMKRCMVKAAEDVIKTKRMYENAVKELNQLKKAKSRLERQVTDRERQVTRDDHISDLRQVIERLRRHGLTAKPSKCEIGHVELDLLGHVVGGGSIKPHDKKLEKDSRHEKARNQKGTQVVS